MERPAPHHATQDDTLPLEAVDARVPREPTALFRTYVPHPRTLKRVAPRRGERLARARDASLAHLCARMQRSKVVQWTIAYLALAVVTLEVADNLSGIWRWSETFQRGLSLGLGLGVLPASVVAWYHGEKGRQCVTACEILLLGGLLVLISLSIWRVAP